MKFQIALLVVCFISSIAEADVVANNMTSAGYVTTGWATSVGYSRPQSGYTNEGAAQEFTVSKTGLLTTISATVDRFVGGEPLIVSLYTASNGLPDLFVGSVQVPESEFSGALNTFDFSSLNVLLLEGQNYIVTFTVNSAIYQSTRYRSLLTQLNENSFGVRSLISKDGVSWAPLNVAPEIGLIVEASPLTPPPVEVGVDILSRKINLKSKKPKPLDVAVMGSAELDVAEIELQSILFGDAELTDPELGSGTAVAPVSGTFSDVNGDGYFDLIATFDVNELKSAGAIDSSSVLFMLEGEFTNSQQIYGSVEFSGGNKGKGPKK